MQTRYSLGGDEHIFIECDEEMSLEAFFKSRSITKALEDARIEGVTEVCQANASLQVRFDPDKVKPAHMLARIQALEAAAGDARATLDTRIIEVPVYYNDPWTRESLMRFRDRHQDPSSTDLEYTARINGFPNVEALIKAHHGAPWLVTMVGFAPGVPWLYQLVDKSRQIQSPKYVRPRTDTPKLTLGHGGCFGAVYSIKGAGGYQMLGILAIPVYDPKQQITYLRDAMCLFTPGDIVKWKPIDRAEYDATVAAVTAGTYELRTRRVKFSLEDFNRDLEGTTSQLTRALHGH
jgi:urea carboxylase